MMADTTSVSEIQTYDHPHASLKLYHYAMGAYKRSYTNRQTAYTNLSVTIWVTLILCTGLLRQNAKPEYEYRS